MSIRYISTALVATLLTACGGGDKGGSTAPPAPDGPVFTGNFIDSAVEGLRYKTPTQSGLTNDLGEFTYSEGESVEFYVGGTLLGITLGAETITPFSLFGLTPPATEFEISNALSTDEVNSFDRAINIATLLQTLDVDGNPDNGIDLGDSDTSLENISIPLLVKATQFEQQVEFKNATTLAGVTKIRTYGDAAIHLYESLGVVIESSRSSNFVSTQDTEQLAAVSYEYDSNGRLSSESTDTNNDGQPDAIKTYQYDSQGNLTQITNSASNTTETLEYDENNNLKSRLIDKSGNQDIKESYSYANNKIKRFDLDLSADGTIDSSTSYTYDSAGNLTKYQVDKNSDGESDSVSSYTYEGNVITSFVEDSDNNGVPNIIIAYTYDDNGNRISHNIDMSVDGLPNTLSTFEYDDNNNAIYYEQDRDIDGRPDYIEANAYDRNNKRIRYSRDINADGKWDKVTQYFYDDNGNRIRMIEDSDGNGVVDKIWTGAYQAAILDNTWESILEKL